MFVALGIASANKRVDFTFSASVGDDNGMAGSHVLFPPARKSGEKRHKK